MMNPMQIMGQVKQFRENMLRQNPGMNPQEMVNQMVSSGKVSQQQFEQARNIVESLGMKF
ncbi:hypothetical protein [Selenomonas sp. AE3005]|uniref:hypothetical protein n=1 Tax=Selenomonas sp. AE3005 TaxID=1485543 RepID=UPI000481C463|nr:hypothetical protein [Selenomonas sp. AE3005]